MEGGNDNYEKDEIYSKVVRAGKRTYFFDVKSTRGNDLYLTITESKKRIKDDGDSFYEKHKIFLYKEDFDKFTDGLEDALGKIGSLKEGDSKFKDDEHHSSKKEEFTDVNFEDLGD